MDALKKELAEVQEQFKLAKEEAEAALTKLKSEQEEERTSLTREREAIEEKLRDHTEKLREKLESEKNGLHTQIREKESEILKLKKDMDEMRDNIQIYQQKLCINIIIHVN